MEYCGPRGIPHSEFLSWSEDDQDKALAWTLEERSRCKRCGTKPEEWLDAEGKYILPPPYDVKTLRCVGCQAIAEEREEIPEEDRESIQIYLGKNKIRNQAKWIQSSESGS